LKIAVFHNTASEGGARRALASLLRNLHKNHSIDLYTCIPISENMVPISDAVDKVIVTSVNWIANVEYKSRLLTKVVNLGVTVRTLSRYKRAAKRVAQQIDARGYDVVITDVCVVTMASDVLYYVKTPSVFLCQNPMRRVREPDEFFKSPSPAVNSRSDAFYERCCRSVDSLQKLILRNRERRNARAATRLVCNSLYSREAIYHAYGLMAYPITLGVDNNNFYPLDLQREDFVLSVGGLQYNKGFHLVVDALALCPADTRPPLTLVANRSEGAIIDGIKKRAAAGGVDLRILHNISDQELLELHNKAQMVVFMPLMEPFGLVTIEAMACGTPVVVSSEGGPREVVQDGRNGLLAERTPESIAAAVQRLQNDAELRSAIGRCGLKDVADKYNWKQSAKQLEENLLKVIKDH
jgi:glycosyltransferase involved in cell wall biosynthesis